MPSVTTPVSDFGLAQSLTCPWDLSPFIRIFDKASIFYAIGNNSRFVFFSVVEINYLSMGLFSIR
jgi:hypothetical protein